MIGCNYPPKQYSIRYDGVYCNEDDQSNHYLKFSSDSTVQGLSLSGDTRNLKTIFEVPPPGIEVGRFKINIDSIEFETKCYEGVLTYKGIIVDSNNLSLKINSHINGRSSHENFVFIKY